VHYVALTKRTKFVHFSLKNIDIARLISIRDRPFNGEKKSIPNANRKAKGNGTFGLVPSTDCALPQIEEMRLDD